MQVQYLAPRPSIVSRALQNHTDMLVADVTTMTRKNAIGKSASIR
jgi:hypothetical protein